MSLIAREIAGEAAARRRMIANCPRHEPVCVRTGRLGRKIVLHYYRCDACGWEYGYDRRIAEKEGLPLPELEPPTG